MLKKLFLPVGMLVAVALAALAPAIGRTIKSTCGSSVFILLIFFVCGWQTEVGKLHLDKRFFVTLLLCGITTLLVMPWCGVVLAKVCGLDKLAMTGLVVMACVPPTLSSGIVMTETAEGDVMLGVIMTVLYNLLGVVTMPLVLTWCLASGEGIDTQPGKMFLQLLLLVVLPFAIGFLIRKWSGKKLPAWCGYIPSLCVILLILFFFSSANQVFKTYPVSMLGIAAMCGLIMRVGLLVFLWYLGKMLHLPDSEKKAVIFTAGSKTLTIALTMLAILDIGGGPAMIPCMVFYFIQSIIDAMLSAKMGLAYRKKAAAC